MNPSRVVMLTCMVFAAAAARLVPHPWNFTPIGAMALFGGAQFADRRLSLVVPFAAMLCSDAIIGFSSGSPFVYLAFAMIVCLGFFLRSNRTLARTAMATLASSVLFYLVTNFHEWAMASSSYAGDLSGLVTCYVAALPFFGNTVLGDAFFVTVLFGSWSLIEKKLPVQAAACLGRVENAERAH